MNTPRLSNAELLQEADALLKAAGFAELCVAQLSPYEIPKQIFSFFAAYGDSFRGPPSRRLYVPGHAKPLPSKTATTSGRICGSCGDPLSKWASATSAATCRSCYIARAVEKHKAKIVRLQEKTEAFQQKFSYSVSLVDCMHDANYDRVQRDFVPDLLDDINDVEVATGVPAAFWLRVGLDADLLLGLLDCGGLDDS